MINIQGLFSYAFVLPNDNIFDLNMEIQYYQRLKYIYTLQSCAMQQIKKKNNTAPKICNIF